MALTEYEEIDYFDRIEQGYIYSRESSDRKAERTVSITETLFGPPDIFPFGNFCKRGDYCPRCTYDCMPKRHATATSKLWDIVNISPSES